MIGSEGEFSFSPEELVAGGAGMLALDNGYTFSTIPAFDFAWFHKMIILDWLWGVNCEW